jgi:hypothetical protein
MKQKLLAWGMIALLMTSFTACESNGVKNATVKYTFPAEWEKHVCKIYSQNIFFLRKKMN